MHIVAVTVKQNIRLNVPERTNRYICSNRLVYNTIITQIYVIQTVILILFWCYCYNLSYNSFIIIYILTYIIFANLHLTYTYLIIELK